MSKTKKDTRLTGLHPLAYVGVEPKATPYFLTNNRAPTVDDKYNFQIGDIWEDRTELDIWMLVNLDESIATWIKFETSMNVAVRYVTDAGTAIPSGGELNVIGSSVLETAGATNVVDMDFINGTDGQLIIGATGSDPAWANITGTTVIVTNGANSINLEGVGIATLLQFTSDSGIATPVAGVVYMKGGSNIDTSAVSDTLTVSLSDDVTIAGTLTLSYLGAGVMQTDAAGLVFSDNGTNGQVLIGGGTAPAWANITSTGGTIVITDGVNSINLEAPGLPIESKFLAYLNGTTTFYFYPAYKSFGLGKDKIMTEVFDANNDFYIGDGAANYAIFTAPQTAKYHLTYQVHYDAVNMAAGNRIFRMVMQTSKHLITNYRAHPKGATEGTLDDVRYIEIVTELDIGDTVQYRCFWFPSSGLPAAYYADIVGGTGLKMETFVSGCIVE